MAGAGAVNIVHHRHNRCSFAATGGTYCKDQSLIAISYFFQYRRQVQSIELQDFSVYPPGCKANDVPLPKNIYAESVFGADFIGEVQSSVFKEKFSLVRTEYLKDHLLYSFFGHCFAGSIFELSLNTQFGWLTDLQVQVARLGSDSSPEKPVQLRLIIRICARTHYYCSCSKLYRAILFTLLCLLYY